MGTIIVNKAGEKTNGSTQGAFTRRQFLKAGGAATALAVGSGLGLSQPAWAAPRTSSADPRPIPYGTPFLFPDPTIFHVEAPGYPLPNPPFDTNPATSDPSTITDFNGFVGLVYVGGQGTHHGGRVRWTGRSPSPRYIRLRLTGRI